MSINRSAGILMPISSLPSKHGIGTLGVEAYKFVDFLKKANQTYWQVLPIGPTSYGDSPYQTLSTYAGNPYFIDLDILVKDGLLKKSDIKDIKNNTTIDYGYLYETRFDLLYIAYQNGKEKFKDEFNKFKNENIEWLDDYSLFMALKKHFKMANWQQWPDSKARLRDKDTLNHYRDLLSDSIEYYSFIQYLFYKQYYELKKYANDNGIKIIGDLPIYMPLDSVEVWSNSKEFQLDKNLYPKKVAGVPPDYFSATGQLWGNPLYDWDKMKTNGYHWWINRIGHVSKLFDVIRLDHFRGFHEYWAVDASETTAINGEWVKGPQSQFVCLIRDWFSNVDFIAEDLGILTEGVKEMLKESGFPGMRVLEFGTNPDGSSYHNTHHHIKNCICYTGTHDNIPVNGWWKSLDKETKEFLIDYYGLNDKEGISNGLIRSGMASCADLFIAQLSDYLGLDEKATINMPGTMNNWTWRVENGLINNTLAKKIAKITNTFERYSIKKEEL